MIKTLYKLIDSLGLPFPTDKVLHFLGCIVVAFVVGYIAKHFGAEYPQGYGVLAGAIVGIGKEILDEYRFRQGKHPEGANFFDFFSSLGGTFFGGLAVVILL